MNEHYQHASPNVYKAVSVMHMPFPYRESCLRARMQGAPASATTAYGGKRDIDVILPLRHASALAQPNRRHSHANRRYYSHMIINNRRPKIKLSSRARNAHLASFPPPFCMCPISKARRLIRVACDCCARSSVSLWQPKRAIDA